ncbi:hypothetical protein OA93_15500 [Flavobacterium sp. KMS]|uniref:hypothetical protein n=1 Tax=Flavobacterium sp. KMS TaxID=1566023 RepID=UPI00057C7F3E|nr:hypothetical protein [Flavobacterium sp. KMS]KIA97327.1 hypothetical protein OA93_15500 [Flavobacterium sp. KMS]
MNYKEKISATIFFFISITYIYFATRDMNRVDKSIQKNKKVSIGKVQKFKQSKSFQIYHYIYFYDGMKYKRSQDVKRMGGDSLVGRYFRIELSTKELKYANMF